MTLALPDGLAQPLMALSFAAPCFSMGFRLLSVWRDPLALEQGRWVQLGIGVFVLEFILLHAGIMLGANAMSSSGAAAAMVLYFALVIASVVLPWPKLGITDTVAADTRMPKASGLWVEQPHRAIGPATVYFLLLGVVEVLLMTWVDPHSLAPR